MKVETSYTPSENAVFRTFRRLLKFLYSRSPILIFGIGLCIVLLCLFGTPMFLGAWYYQAGYRALELANGPQERQQLTTAVALLERSREWSPINADLDFALAQTYIRLEQPQQAIPFLESAVRLRPDSLNYRQTLASTYELVDEIEKARNLFAYSGVATSTLLSLGVEAARVGDVSAAQQWYRRANILAEEPFDTFDEPFSEHTLIVESFESPSQLLTCSWCLSAPDGHFVIEQGVMEMRYTNVPDQRDGFGIVLFPKTKLQGFQTLKLRVRGDPETLVVMELVLNHVRTRTLHYQPAPDDWQVWSIPLPVGDTLDEIVLLIAETDSTSTVEQARLQIDWIALE
jgi:hypothetical protein